MPRFSELRALGGPAWPLVGTAVALLAGCGDMPTPPPEVFEPGIMLVSGALTDTVQATPAQPLTFRVAGPDGLARAGLVVRFEPEPVQVRGYTVYPITVSRSTASDFRNFAVDTTDHRGLAAVRIQVGPDAGPARIKVSVPELGYQHTSTFVILPGSAAHVVAAPRDTAVYAGNQLQLRGVATDLFGNRRGDPVTFAALNGPVTVLGSGTVTAGAQPGRAAVVARFGPMADTAYVSVVPRGWLAVQTFNPGNGGPLGFMLTQLDGSENRILAPGLDNRVQPKGFGWSADGQALFIPRANRIVRLELSGAESTLREFAGPVTSVRASRDGAWIYFTATDPYWQSAAIHRMRPDGSGLERITSPSYGRSEYSPSPSPDGRYLAFVSNMAWGRVHVWDLEGNRDMGVAVPGRAAAWSPVASEIAYHDESQLRVMRPDGSLLRDLGTLRGIPSTIDWSPDGNWIVISFVWGLAVTVVHAQSGLQLPLGNAESMGEAAWRP
jgi:dipeptidyl aminopeptidase/acylaminoacyl peptidase